MIKKNTIQHYDKKAVKLAYRYESADVTRLQGKLISSMKNCTNILELGCGSGRDAAFLKSSLPGRQLTITDGSKEMLHQAVLLHPELSSNLRKLELPKDLILEREEYDGIYSIAALMHLPESSIAESLNRIAQLLLPDGVLFISVCTDREVSPADESRTFTLKNRGWWISQIEEAGLRVLELVESTDGLNREKTIWLNITAEAPH